MADFALAEKLTRLAHPERHHAHAQLDSLGSILSFVTRSQPGMRATSEGHEPPQECLDFASSGLNLASDVFQKTSQVRNQNEHRTPPSTRAASLFMQFLIEYATAADPALRAQAKPYIVAFFEQDVVASSSFSLWSDLSAKAPSRVTDHQELLARARHEAMRAQLLGALIERDWDVAIAGTKGPIEAMVEAANTAMSAATRLYRGLAADSRSENEHISFRARWDSIFRTYIEAHTRATLNSGPRATLDGAEANSLLGHMLRVYAVNERYQLALLESGAGRHHEDVPVKEPDVTAFLSGLRRQERPWTGLSLGLTHLLIANVDVDGSLTVEVRPLEESEGSGEHNIERQWATLYDKIFLELEGGNHTRRGKNNPLMRATRALKEMAQALAHLLPEEGASSDASMLRTHAPSILPESVLCDLPWLGMSAFRKDSHASQALPAYLQHGLATDNGKRTCLVVVSEEIAGALEPDAEWRLDVQAPYAHSVIGGLLAAIPGWEHHVLLVRDVKGVATLQHPGPAQWLQPGASKSEWEHCGPPVNTGEIYAPNLVLWLTHGEFSDDAEHTPRLALHHGTDAQLFFLTTKDLLDAKTQSHIASDKLEIALRLPDATQTKVSLNRATALLIGACTAGRIDPFRAPQEGVGLIRALLTHAPHAELLTWKSEVPLNRISHRDPPPFIEVFKGAMDAVHQGKRLADRLPATVRAMKERKVLPIHWAFASLHSNVWLPQKEST